MTLTLGELLDQPHLKLDLLTDPAGARDRPVNGAHAIEVAAPSRWVPRDWVMLTNGLRVRGRPAEQQRLVAELADSGQAGLGWAVGLVLQRVPPAVVAEAERRDFPVFLVPIQTAFHEIITFVHDARSNDEMYVMRRMVAIEDYLMDALHLRQPERAIVGRLAQTLHLDVALTDAGGLVIEHSGLDLDPALAPAIAAGETAPVAAALDRDVAIHVVPHEGGHPRILVVASRHYTATDPLVKAVLGRAVHLLGLLASNYRRDALIAKTQGADILRRSLRKVTPAQARSLDAEATALNVAPASGVVLAQWELPATAGAKADADPLATVSDHLVRCGIPHLAADVEGVITTMTPAGHGDLGIGDGRRDGGSGAGDGSGGAGSASGAGGRDAAGSATERDAGAAVGSATAPAGDPADLPDVRCVGIGPAITSLADAPRGFDGARLALIHARATDGFGSRVVHFSALDNISWLVGGITDPDELGRIAGMLDPLLEHPQLLETLSCWFAADWNVNETAARLHLHRNSLRYRMSRIEQLLGVELSSPRETANLQLALLARELLGSVGEAGES